MEKDVVFRNKVHSIINRKTMLSHPFYQAWTKGELSIKDLQYYAGQYYHHVLAEPTYLSAVHTNAPAIAGDLSIRQEILENLIEEERGPDNHPSLWKSFAGRLGCDVETLHSVTQNPATTELINTYIDLTKNYSFLCGMAAMYSFEWQIPEVAEAKIAGLKAFYGFSNPEDYKFFSVHKKADVVHSERAWNIIQTHTTPEQEEIVLFSVERAAQALFQFLDGIWFNLKDKQEITCH